MEKRGTSGLADRLQAIGYWGLFQGPDKHALNTLWSEANVPEALATLAGDPEAAMLARFLAAEILFEKQQQYPPVEQKQPLASVYVTALAKNFTGTANTWGFPDILGGLAAEHLVALGPAAIPALSRQLDDDTPVYYEGSEEATIGDTYAYRVKDLAAFYIHQISNTLCEPDEDPGRRDEQIAKLKSALK